MQLLLSSQSSRSLVRSMTILLPATKTPVGSHWFCLSRRTTAVTGPPPRNYDFKTRVIGGYRSPLGSSVWDSAA
jgi:hypothetical protein